MMDFLQSAAYVVAVLLVATLPAAIAYWLLIHPFAAFWRRQGKALAFGSVAVLCIALAVAIGWQHKRLLSVHWGYHWPMIAAGLVLYAVGAYIEHKIRKQLDFRTLVGVPELNHDSPGRLLTGGIYAYSRNPRYVNIVLVMFGWALILNYPIIYGLTVLLIPALWVVVLFEERELRERFGDEYIQYCREVPRFVPGPGRR